MSHGQKRFISLQQLAEFTGLSVSAVSSVLNNKWKERRISEDSKQRVLVAAQELGYVPNIFARKLGAHRSGTNQALLAIVTSFDVPLALVSRSATALHRAINKVSADTHYTVTIDMFERGELPKLAGFMKPHQFSGAIIANTSEVDDQFIAGVTIPYPVVLINRVLPHYASVNVSRETGSGAAKILMDAGCQRCAVFLQTHGSSVMTKRANDFAETMRGAGRSVTIAPCSGRSELEGYNATRELLRHNSQVDGIFVVNDSLAIGAYHAIHKSGRSIPQDIQIVGVGDHTASPFLYPPLTCIGSSEDQLHQAAADLLLGLISGKEKGAPHRYLPQRVVRRQSTL